MKFYVHFKTYQKVISMFLIISFLTVPLTFLTLPKKAEAVCTPFTIPPIPDVLSVPTHPSVTNSWNIGDAFEKSNTWFKTCILDGLATVIAKTIIKQLTASIVTWINSGFKGNPSFVQNPGKFFGGIADKVAGNVIENIAPFLCSPFRLNIQLTLSLGQSSQADDLSCTLTDVESNIKNFAQGTGGGWDNWFQITQNPQNNPYGATAIAQAQLTAGIETAQGKYDQQLNWGQGFLSFEDCPANQISGAPGEVPSPTTGGGTSLPGSGDRLAFNPNDNGTLNSNSLASIGSLGLLDSIFGNSSNKALAAVGSNSNTGSAASNLSGAAALSSNVTHVNPDNPNDKQVYDANNQPVYGVQAGNNGCVTETPGAVIESQLNNVLGSDLRGLEIAQSIDQIVAALVGQLVSKALGGIGGLVGASGGGSSSGSSSGFDYQGSVNGASGSTQGAAASSVPNLPLTGACSPSTQNAQIGEPVTWSAYIPSINGDVKYTWYGTDDPTSNGSSVTMSYSSAGQKDASVIVTTTGANPQTAQFDCVPSVIIGDIHTTASTPTISCAASTNSIPINIPVTWQAIVVGGIGPFVYSWQGDEGLIGSDQTAIKSYSTAGPKTATVNVTSADGNTYTHTCSAPVKIISQ